MYALLLLYKMYYNLRNPVKLPLLLLLLYDQGLQIKKYIYFFMLYA